jgi:hypothetical protein
MTLRHSFLVCSLLAAAAAHAYPPAPAHTLFGLVRDENGRALATGTAIVIVSNAAGEIVRGPVATAAEAGVNYTLQLPMDSGTLTSLYRPTALLPTAGFTLRVIRDNVSYLPIEVSRVPPTIGLPGQRTRLDLTLGIDSDNDGLPDAWEQALIDHDRSGRLRTLADVKPGDDLDGDGLTNLQEYLLGTYALDPADGLVLAILEVAGGSARLRFTVVTGRNYSIKGSTDLQTWAGQTFAVGTVTAPAVTAFRATEVTVVDVWIPLPPGGTAFYRLYAE